MDLSHVNQLDNVILLSILNEKLRIECNSYEELASRYELDTDMVRQKLADVGYHYDPLTNQFKAV
ncbi:DUF4250 domain-containing protein [Vibrio sp. SM6]|uniref:DUF4250 domain-containing protein n=1 Tax=Vibrio agarilyticus TaxID=2726741 RepID=A0A7X8TQK2_9VIBR|nr:DUF4250 domain-containing protein [Vibrio agarilyticus]NLS13023.1 DUF4250 domain-containing protein [Vibrio agarilyticus]